MGVDGRYQRVDVYCLPEDAAARRYFWNHIHASAHPRRTLWARWQPHPREALPGAAEAERRLAAWAGGPVACVWRPAAPGVSRAGLGWVFRRGRLIGLARWGTGAGCELVRRHRRGLELLARYPALAATTPEPLWVDEETEAILTLESACEGAAPRPGQAGSWTGAEAAAEWLAGLQRLTLQSGAGANRWRTDLAAAIARHEGLRPGTRERVLGRLERQRAPVMTAAHGDLWWGNLLVSRGGGLAVVDWSECREFEHPWHDVAFFLLTYARDSLGGGHDASPRRWLTETFRKAAESWLQRYNQASPAPLGWEELTGYAPLMMARYACFGQQAAAWTRALNAWFQAMAAD